MIRSKNVAFDYLVLVQRINENSINFNQYEILESWDRFFPNLNQTHSDFS